jgi:hypothetical protein
MHEADQQVYGLAAAQGGGFARRQVLDLGVDDKLIERRCEAGAWMRVRPGVYVVGGLPPSRTTSVWIAWLEIGPHAVRSHECAAEVRGLHPVPSGRLVFTSHHGDHHKIPDVTVHQLKDLLPHHTSDADGLPTTTAARTIVDLAAVCGFERLRQILENGVNDDVTTDDEVGAVLHEVARPGKWGVKKLQRVLATRAPGDPVPDSVLERLLLDALLSAGLPLPVPQFPHPGRDPGRGRVDFAYPEAKLILEADGRRWHQRVADVRRDRARDIEAARAGWLTMRFMWEELSSDPADSALAVVEALSHRIAA